MDTTYLVRLKPYDKRAGYLVENYLYKHQRFTSRWSEVSRAIADELRELGQPHMEKIPLFDVVTKKQAIALEQKERDDGLGIKRVASADKIPDAAFTSDAPRLNLAAGEIDGPQEEIDDPQGEIDALPSEISDVATEAAPAMLTPTLPSEPAPAPSLRARVRARSSI